MVATGLNQPRKLSFGPHGDLYVAEAGDNTVPASCTDGTEESCQTSTGGVARVSPSGTVTQVLSGLPSVSGGFGSPGASGPADVQVVDGQLQVVIQNTGINSHTGAETYGPGGALLGDLITVPVTGGTPTVEAQFGPFEAANNPDHGAGAGGPFNPIIDSDPYAVVAYHGGWAVADAAANDVLWVSPTGVISVLAVLPLLNENGVQAEAVPTSLAVGPDGALYIGQLGGGAGSDVGDTNIYRLVPGAPLEVYASGFTMVGDIAFDQAGRLLVLEVDQNGLDDPSPFPAPGALIRVNADGSRTTLASTGLEFPLGIAVAADGSIYVSNLGVVQGSGDPDLPPGFSGEIVRVADPVPADEIGANFGGYREVASDGGIFTFGALGFYGSEGGKPLNAPIVGMAATPIGPGYWEVASDGGIFTFGTAGFYGSEGGKPLNAPIVGMAATPDGRGYWEVASDGGIFTFGDAGFYGSEGGKPLNAPIVGMAPSVNGSGYFLFAADGGVFTFGNAVFQGSEGGHPLNAPIIGGARQAGGGGYYLVAADGGVFTFGTAVFAGSEGGHPLNAPVVGLNTTPDGAGYYLVGADGGVFTFGTATFYGSEGGHPLNQPVIGLN